MIHQAVVERYARTFLLAGKQADALKDLEKDFLLVKEVLKMNPEFQAFIKNPVISSEDKELVIKKSFESKVSLLTIHILQLLIKKNRLELLAPVLDEFQNVLDTHNNVVKGTVYSVTPLEDSQLSEITKKYEQRNNIVHIFDNKIDSSLLGGFVVRVGDKVEDLSLQNKLEHLKNKLLA